MEFNEFNHVWGECMYERSMYESRVEFNHVSGEFNQCAGLITQGEVYQVFGEFNRVCEQSRVQSATMRLVSLIACLVSLITYGELNHASSEFNQCVW
jgi:hypothetical protein